MSRKRRACELDANCSHSLNPVFLDFRVGFKIGSCITEGKKQTQEKFSLEGEKILEFQWHLANIQMLTSCLGSSIKGIVFLPKYH